MNWQFRDSFRSASLRLCATLCLPSWGSSIIECLYNGKHTPRTTLGHGNNAPQEADQPICMTSVLQEEPKRADVHPRCGEPGSSLKTRDGGAETYITMSVAAVVRLAPPFPYPWLL